MPRLFPLLPRTRLKLTPRRPIPQPHYQGQPARRPLLLDFKRIADTARAFVTNLRKDRDGLDQVHAHNQTEVQEGTEDTALIDAQLTLINTEVDILDSIMGNIYELQLEKLHAWKRASRVERDPKRAKKDLAGATIPSADPA